MRSKIRDHTLLKSALLRPRDDLILQSLAQIAEIIAVAGHAHDQVAVLLGVLLRLAQGVGFDHVELDVMAVHLEIRTHQMGHLLDALLVRQKLGGELLVEQGAAGAQVVDLGCRADHGRGAVAVRALHGGNALGERLGGVAPVRHGPDHRAEIHVAGGRQQVDLILPALGVGSSADRVVIEFKDLAQDVVGGLVVVAVFGRLVDQGQAQLFVPGEVGVQGGD